MVRPPWSGVPCPAACYLAWPSRQRRVPPTQPGKEGERANTKLWPHQEVEVGEDGCVASGRLQISRRGRRQAFGQGTAQVHQGKAQIAGQALDQTVGVGQVAHH